MNIIKRMRKTVLKITTRLADKRGIAPSYWLQYGERWV